MFRERLAGPSPDPLIQRAVDILRTRFVSDPGTPGYRKDGPTDYARFRTNPGQPELDPRHRRDAADVVEQFLVSLGQLAS
jgi:hypothetical protein